MPEELGGAQEESGPHLPAHHVRPLVQQNRQVPIALHPLRVHRVDDRLGRRPNDVRLFELLAAGLGDHRELRGEALDVLLLPDSNLFLKFQNNFTAAFWATFSHGLLLQRFLWNSSGIFIISMKADTRNFSKKYQQNFLLDAIFFEQ